MKKTLSIILIGVILCGFIALFGTESAQHPLLYGGADLAIMAAAAKFLTMLNPSLKEDESC